ncbi:restriction endonuclease [Lacihabitans lacunae]|uniref:Restriction endonuclease n=1 Tax=Lacihabitans lacunae TaxID=1028214 RepID=A0ABV7YXJ7_9BACT
MKEQAFIIRCNPSGTNRLNEILKEDQIVIGWSKTKDILFDKTLNREDFKQKIKESYYPQYEENPYSLGQATGYMWRFIREINIGDTVIIPISKAFYIGKVESDNIYLEDKINEDTSIRRKVKWLNDSKPILREYCGSGLISRLKYQGTCVNASDLIDDIELAIISSKKRSVPTFKNQLNESLKHKVTEFLVSKEAYLDDRKFEELVKQLMLGLGASTSEIPAKTRYKGSIADVDILANFVHLGIQIYVQVKKHKKNSDELAVNQIIEAIKIDNPDNSKPIFGWVVTSGTFTETAQDLADKNGIRVINGDDLAEMIVTVGLEKF